MKRKTLYTEEAVKARKKRDNSYFDDKRLNNNY